MSGHDGCGCGHAHAAPEAAGQVHAHDEHLAQEGGCGEGCGCSGGDGLSAHPLETAALRGFLSGIYASRLDAAQLKTYLEQMGSEEDSEFGRPAQFLSAALADLAEAGALDAAEPPAFVLLDAVSGDDEDGSEEE